MDTRNLVPIRKTAERLDVSVQCAFNNRHHFLSLLEEIVGNEKELTDGRNNQVVSLPYHQEIFKGESFILNQCVL